MYNIIKNVSCVVMSVRVLCCGNVQHIHCSSRVEFLLNCKKLGNGFEPFDELL